MTIPITTAEDDLTFSTFNKEESMHNDTTKCFDI